MVSALGGTPNRSCHDRIEPVLCRDVEKENPVNHDMAHFLKRPDWYLPESAATSPSAYANRRAFIKSMGLGTIGLATMGCGPSASNSGTANASDNGNPTTYPVGAGPLDTIPENAPRIGLPATRNANYVVPERPVTTRLAASSYNNYYEFISQGDLKTVWPLVDDYKPFPHSIDVRGHVEKRLTLDVEDLIREFGLEERVYRFRCVEAWSMTIPWTGFPLSKLIERCKPTSKATHVRFWSTSRPKEMPGIPAAPWLDFPYFEGLRMDEAMNEMAFMATGMYGEPLPKQNGSPLRMVLPWKYGYKGAKAISRIEFVDKEPETFWNDLYPQEYGFLSNINPNIPHPRWTQATERFMRDETNLERIPTQLFNGYADQVGSLYPDEPTKLTRTVR